MALVSEIINRSLRLLNVIDAGSATPAIDSETAIVALNAMVNRWEANGLALGWIDATAVGDTLSAPLEANEAIAYNLAVKLAPEYSPPSSFALVIEQAKQSLMELRRDMITQAPITQQTSLPGARGRHYNITTDDYV